ncbi:MAG: hypothetical protein JO146_06810 [Candidatus Eremiobacteraeota bacterium]|nr:hypothetical protein [Candidatus Eremiobacteraeota bacterium]
MLISVSENVRSLGKGLLPLIVGVTGHRDLAQNDDSEIAALVRGFLCNLQTTYPHTPMVLLSSLAEGADRVVAQAALDCGVELYVVLPMETSLYEQDFASDESVEQFRRLMAHSYGARIVEAPGPERDRHYAAAGAFIVSHSEILIALWDGNEDEMRGGTSQIVRFALRGVPTDYLSGPREALRSNETGAVYHIPVRRQSALKPAAAATWRYPETDSSDPGALGAARAAFEENLRNLERFNRDAVASPSDSSTNSSGLLLSPQQEAALGASGALHYTRALFGQADQLALKCRNWTYRATVSIFGAVALATLLFALYTDVMTDRAALYFGFLAIVVLAFAIDLIIVRKRMQDRFQDYRALAEGLRVQFYWRLAGIHDSVYDHYFARQEGELDWIRNAMRAESFRPQRQPDVDASPGRMRALLETVLAQWIQGEGTYFARVFRREREIANRIRWSANACLVATAVAALLLAVTVARSQPAYHGILIAILTLALAGAGLLTGYAQKRAHEEHARRYRRMAALYRVAGDRLGILLQQGDLTGARRVLVQLGREALAETCDWLLLHRERQIDVPTG